MSESSKYKKCLVLDLDNTLWGGIIGEDGIDGIQLGVSEPGSHYLAFQRAILDLYERGVILAIASRNNEDEAMQVLTNHPNQILRHDHFSAKRINWQSKSTNIIDLANELNIGLDSLVFLDDDPINRAEVRERVPEVTTPDLPTDPSQYSKFLNSLSLFPPSATTDEDKMRGNFYVTEILRKESRSKSQNEAEFLKNLGVEVLISINNEAAIPRLAQLTEKTNQFNFFKQPLTVDAVKNLTGHPDYRIYHASVLDTFGDNGITNVAIAKRMDEKNWQLEQFLMSCRVINRGIEQAFLAAIAKELAALKGKFLHAQFAKTEKNAPAEEFYAKVFKGKPVELSKLEIPDWVQVKFL